MKAKLSQDKRRRSLVKLNELHFKKIKAGLRKECAMDAFSYDASRKKLAKLSRKCSKTRVRNRCVQTGRARSVYKAFKLSRMPLRNFSCEGRFPGFYKASW